MKTYYRIKISLFFRIVSWFLVIFIIPLQIILQKQLRTLSKDLIITIQDGRTDAGINFFKLIRSIVAEDFLAGFAPFAFNILHPKSSATLIIFTVLINYFGNLIALLIQEPRPFWYSAAIKGELCLEGYGNPSIPILYICTILPIIFIETFHSNKFRVIFYTFLVIFVIITGFSGIYLGDSFPHQIITTLFLGFALVTVYFSLYPTISSICFESCYGYLRNRRNLIKWIIFVFSLIALVSLVKLILIEKPAFYAKYVSNSLKHCGNSYEPDGEYNYKLSLSIFYALGFVCGNINNSKKMTIYWMVTSWWKRILRFVICFGLDVGIYIGFRAIPVNDSFMTSSLHYAIPYFIMSYLYTGILPPIFAKCGIANNIKPEVDSEIILTQIEDKVVI